MTQYLPPNLLALFAPRAALEFKPPVQKLPHEKKTAGYQGIGQFMQQFEDPNETPAPVRIETREERQERKRKERAEQVAYKLEQDIALWDPYKNSASTTDPYKTLFIARTNYDTSESKLRREFEAYGPIRRISLVHNNETGKPRGYAFIEYEHERDMHTAYKHADGKKIDGRRVLVDVERGRTVKGWLPRRLGGGLGGTRRGGPDVNVKHSGREDSRLDERYLDRERERGSGGGGGGGGGSSGGGEREREKRRSTSRTREHKRRSRSRSRERHRDRHKHRDSTRDGGDRSRGERGAERGERGAERGAERGERGAERGERGADRGERGVERGERGGERGERGGERGAERGGERGVERGVERGAERSVERGLEKVDGNGDGVNNGMAPPVVKRERTRRSRSRERTRDRDRDRKRRRSRSRSRDRKRRDRDRDRADRTEGTKDQDDRREPPTPRVDNEDKDERMLLENVVIKQEPMDDGYSNSNTGYNQDGDDYNYDEEANHFNFPSGENPDQPYIKYEPEDS